ncbi:hypothetical protein O7621_23295 [Solwaraspora sp. WMMD937]|uniref:hypothetical protein n=1 Tax=Solwaraspora sp. WMMD937 TaxID=3016090 RepID=UPI00249A13CC|nr:hypothetical protein [Solwaraspora sp. WMMD937]WFE20774.1 hypothetical protein O7621_23295 [Solwaraspora sp. WMMD937]
MRPVEAELHADAKHVLEEILGVADAAKVADISTSSDAIEGVIEVEAFVEAETEGAAVDRLVSDFLVAARAVERSRPGVRRPIGYRIHRIYVEYSSGQFSRGDGGDVPRGDDRGGEAMRGAFLGGQIGGQWDIALPDADDAARKPPPTDGKGISRGGRDRRLQPRYRVESGVGWHPASARPPGM